MSFPWFSTAKYSALALSSSCLGAGVCLLTHQQREEQEIKPEDLPIEKEEKLEEELGKIIEEEQKIKAAKSKFDLASRKNFVYAQIVVCFNRETERLRKAREYNNEYWFFWYKKQDETHRYNECVTKHPIPTEEQTIK